MVNGLCVKTLVLSKASLLKKNFKKNQLYYSSEKIIFYISTSKWSKTFKKY